MYIHVHMYIYTCTVYMYVRMYMYMHGLLAIDLKIERLVLKWVITCAPLFSPCFHGIYI